MTTPAPLIAIFGAGPGISHAVARRFGREGFKAVLVARNADKLRAEVESLAQQGISACSYSLDVADEAALLATVDRIEREQGEAAVVLYNAAAVHVIDIFEEDWRTIRQQMDVNVGGAFTLAKRLLPEFLRRKTGKLFFTGGGFALQPSPQWTSLSVGKAALRNLVQALAGRVAGAPVHVATLTVCGFVKEDDPRYNPDAIAEQFWRLYGMPPGQFTWEVQY